MKILKAGDIVKVRGHRAQVVAVSFVTATVRALEGHYKGCITYPTLTAIRTLGGRQIYISPEAVAYLESCRATNERYSK